METWTKKDGVLAICIPLLTCFISFWISSKSEVMEQASAGWARAENGPCITCHRGVLEERIEKMGDLKNWHRLHLESSDRKYEGKQQLCTTCHEAWTEAHPSDLKRTFAFGGIFHPETSLAPLKKTIRRAVRGPALISNIPFQHENPYIFKPSLKRLICTTCHDNDSKIGPIFYGSKSVNWRLKKEKK